MMKHITFYLFFSLLIFHSCKKAEIVLYSRDYPLYMEGYLESGRFAMLYISNTQNITSPLAFAETNVDSMANYYKKLDISVLLLKDNVVVDSLKGPVDITDYYYMEPTPNSYRWGLQGKLHTIESGGHYRMVIKRKSYPDMIADCIVPDEIRILALDTLNANGEIGFPRTDTTFYYSNLYTYIINFNDPSNQQNFYRIESSRINKAATGKYASLNGWHNLQVFTDNPIFEGHSLYGRLNWSITSGVFFSDKLFNGMNESLAFEMQDASDSLLCIRLVSISEGYYKRLKSNYLFKTNLSDMYAQPTQMYSNFTNAVGFLGGRTVSSDTLRMNFFK